MSRASCVLRMTLGFALAGCAPEAGARRQMLGAAHALFLDFGGASISSGAEDDALAGVSALGSATVPPFDAAIVAPGVDPARVVEVLVDRVRTLYAPFDVDVVTAPPNGDYARVLIGGTGAVLMPAAPSGSAGLATLDCADADPRSVGFAFSDELAPQFGGPVALANAIAHEAGHGYGLEHVVTPTDPMYAMATPTQTLADLFAQRFGSGAYSPYSAGGGSVPEACGRVDPLDNAAILTSALGARTPTSAAPTVGIDFPPSLAALPLSVPLVVSATDDEAVVRVEVYRDLTLVAALTAPPYELDLTLTPSAMSRITVEAVDAEGQRASSSIQVAIDPSAPPPCDALHACPAMLVCVDSACVAPPSDGGLAPDAGGEPPTLGGGGEGCAMTRGPTGANPLALLLAIFVLLRPLDRARSRSRR